MIINSINLNTRLNATNNIHRCNQNVSFKGVPDQDVIFAMDEFFNGKSRGMNNFLLEMAIKKGNYKQAYEDVLSKAGDNYNPNHVHKPSGLPLIVLLYKGFHPVKSILQKKYKDALMVKIMQHPTFNPNDYYYVTKDDKKSIRYLIEDAVETNNTSLVTHLCENSDLEDPFGDDFETVESKTGNPHIRTLLGRAKIRSIFHQVEAVAQEKAAVVSSENLYESDDVKAFRKDIKPDIPAALDEIGGLHKAKTDIQDFIIKPWSKDIRQKLRDNNIDMPNGFMMYGPPGCGKTYIVQVIAKQTGFPMYEVPLSDIGDSAAYSIPKKLKKIFDGLEEQYQKNNIPNILFLDEIDSICASRETAQMDWKRDDINAVITLLNNASDKGIIVIGATNLLENVDKAVLRSGRFDKKIEVSLPTLEERKDILEKLLGKRKIALSLLDDVDKLAEATEGKSCSDLAAIVNDCGRRAIYAGKKSVKRKDFEKSIDIINEANKERQLIGFHN